MMDGAGINAVNFTGFVGQTITTYESKQGTPAIRFQIWVGEPKPRGFWQWVAVYGNPSIRLSTTLEQGDLVIVYGKKAFINFTDNSGRPAHTDFCVAAHCYIMAKASEFQKDK